MTPGLMDKLRMIDGGKTPPAPARPAPASAKGVYSRRDAFELSLFSDFRHATAPVLREVFGTEFPAGLAKEDFLFLDTETTGLSGGAGTLAFQVGLGYFDDGKFVTQQYLMRDYPEEETMLRTVAAVCSRFSALVTFNGKTFDVPLLESRMLQNRLREQSLPALHADVLHPARRLWKLRLGSCSLSRLEEAVLGVRREDDLPGALVPQTYFQYLKDGNFEPLERVLLHNRQDLVSLAQLFFFLLRQHDRPEEVGHGEDLLSLARTLEKRGEGGKAAKCYRLCARGSTREAAFSALAAQEKRKGNADRAIRLYGAMLRRDEAPINACEALAKLHEHRTGDIEAALHYTRRALLLLCEPRLVQDEAVQQRRIALQYRYARLQRKAMISSNQG